MTRLNRKNWTGSGSGRAGAVLLLLLCTLTSAPAGQLDLPSRDIRHPFKDPDTRSDVDPVFSARRLRALNEARQKVVVSDTEKLLRLAQEVSAEAQVAGAGPTAVQSAKIAEIEKLARRVKQKMIESEADSPMLTAWPLSSER